MFCGRRHGKALRLVRARHLRFGAGRVTRIGIRSVPQVAGIPPQHQPPNLYRLLGLEVFESDRDVIRAAAERQTAHIHKYKIGPQSEHSQRLLNEIARARVCLLDPSRKAEYDRALRLIENQDRTPDVAAPPVARPPFSPPHIPIAAVPPAPLDASQLPDDSTDSGTIAPIPSTFDFAVRPRKSERSKQRPAWGPAIAVCMAALILSVIAIKKLADRTQAASTNKSVPVEKAPADEPAPPNRPTPNPPKKKTAASSGKVANSQCRGTDPGERPHSNSGYCNCPGIPTSGPKPSLGYNAIHVVSDGHRSSHQRAKPRDRKHCD